MKNVIVFMVASILLACSNDEYESTISCNEEGCTGMYVGPEFDNSKPNGKKDIAHQFSNKISDRVGNELKKLYKKFTNKDSKVHKYHVLRWDKPSNTIPAHLYKDGLRHIHPDPEQCRSITVREAARLMTFPDNFKFSGSRGDKYKGLGNAVPPKFAEVIAKTIKEVL